MPVFGLPGWVVCEVVGCVEDVVVLGSVFVVDCARWVGVFRDCRRCVGGFRSGHDGRREVEPRNRLVGCIMKLGG